MTINYHPLPMPFTPNQQKAVETTGQWLCVSAGAGSGKTSVLAGRYLHLVLNLKVLPENILALTFTDKAAGEMQERILKEFLAAGRQDLAARLEDSAIGTFHSFALRLLKEYGLEIGLSPGFEIVDPPLARMWLDEVVDRLHEEALEAGHLRRVDCFDLYGPQGIKDLIRNLLGKVRSRGLQPQEVEAAIPTEEEFVEAFMDASQALQALSARLDSLEKPTGPQLVKAAGARKLLADLARLQNPKTWTFEVLWQVENDPEGRLALKGAYPKPVEEEKNRFKEAWEEHFLPVAAGFAAREHLGEIKALLDECSRRLRTRRFREQRLDYDDLLLLSRDLLTNHAPVRQRCREHWQHVVIDEFQDTNQVQMDLVNLLHGSGKNLFVVGDAKQSIYRFRNTDVRLFNAFGEMVAKEGGLIHLQENFRSRSGVLAGVNAACAPLFEGLELSYEPLLPCLPFPAHLHPNWNLLFHVSEEPLKADDMALADARQVAALLKRIVEDERWVVTDKASREHRPARWDDLALLFRAKTSTHLYLDALKKAEIPYKAVLETRLFGQPEVCILLCLLKALGDLGDELSLVAFLRSPLIALSDESLYRLRTAQKGSGKKYLGELLADPAWQPPIVPPEGPLLSHFREQWQTLLKEHRERGLADILEQAVEGFWADSLWFREPDGELRAANVRRLMEVARKLESQGIATLPRLLAYLRAFEEESEEQEAGVEPEEGCVLITTVHRAKGLEFPIVVLPQCHSRRSNHSDSVLLLEPPPGRPLPPRFAMKVKNPFDEGNKFTTPAFADASAVEQREELKEEARIFYVALTRAKEHLILTGITKRNKNGDLAQKGSWWDWLYASWGVEQPEQATEWVLSAAGGKPFTVAVDPQAPRWEQEWEDDGAHCLWDTLGDLFDLDDAAALETLANRFGLDSMELENASQALAAREQPVTPQRHRKPFLSITRLESAEEKGRPAPAASAVEPLEDRILLGITLHHLLETVPLPSSLENAAAHGERLLGKVSDDRVRERAGDIWRQFLDSDFWQRLHRASWVRREVPFSVECGEAGFQGTIDLLFEEGGRLVLADYKTRTGPSTTPKERYRRQLLAYAWAVEQVLGKAPQELGLCSLEDSSWLEVPFTPEDIAETAKWIEAGV